MSASPVIKQLLRRLTWQQFAKLTLAHWKPMMSVLSVNPEEETFLTPQEVSDLLQVSVQTVRRWIKDEDLPAYKVGPRVWRIRRVDLDMWLGQQRSTDFSTD
jgi:excisionase family DNA binding protein